MAILCFYFLHVPPTLMFIRGTGFGPTAMCGAESTFSFFPTASRPGALDQITTETGSTKIRWCVDGQKLESHAEKLISPEFKLGVPGQESQPFRIMILANQTGGKHGAGFKKAKGAGSVHLFFPFKHHVVARFNPFWRGRDFFGRFDGGQTPFRVSLCEAGMFFVS